MNRQAIDRGDFIYVHLEEQKAEPVPALVLSPKAFNETTGFAAICPIAHAVRNWGFEVLLPDGLPFSGFVLTDQLQNIPWKSVSIEIRGRAPEPLIQTCITHIHTYLYE